MKQPVKEGVRDLIIEYFKTDVLKSEPLTRENKENIIQTFTYAWAQHMSIQAICKELQNSNLSKIRDGIIKRMGSNYNPFPLRLGVLKPELQIEAMEHNKSLHGYLLSIFRERHQKQVDYLDLYCVPRLNKMYRYKKPFKSLAVNQLRLEL